MLHFIDGLIIGTGCGLIIAIIKNLISTLHAIDNEPEPAPAITYIKIDPTDWARSDEETPDYFAPF